MSIVIIKPGSHTTIQDLGRWKYQSQGVPVSGAMDEDSLINANILLGNDRNESCLEISSGNVELKFTMQAIVALCGKGIKASINALPIPLNKPIQIKADTVLKFQSTGNGNWIYVSVQGGFDIPKIINSSSTYLPSAFGGWEGRRLKAGDILNLNLSNPNESIFFKETPMDRIFRSTKWGLVNTSKNEPQIRIFQGCEWDWLTNESKVDIETKEFIISPDSSRMGFRFTGERIKRINSQEIISDAVSKGTIQLTNEGNLIVLMADGQTIGGYARVAQVAAVDLPALAQQRAGTVVQFKLISFEEAEQLFLEREQNRVKLNTSIRLRNKYGN